MELEYADGSIFIPKSILKMLLRGIAWYIDDPETYRTYALVHSITAAAAREFRLPKQKEFTIILEKEGYIPIPILPNGIPHGISGYDNNNLMHLFHYGKYIVFNRYMNDIKRYIRFNKNFRITTIYYNSYTYIDISLIFDMYQKKIESYKCNYCDKVHLVRFFDYFNKTNIIYLAGECYKPIKFIRSCEYATNLVRLYLKPSLRSRVVAYARSLAN